MPQITDQAEDDLNGAVDTVTTSWVLTSATEFPDPTKGQYWVWCWDKVTFPNPGDDANAERARVTAKTSNTLTVVRGEAGQTAKAHSDAAAVAMLVDEFNQKCFDRYDISCFGADMTGVADGTASFQKALDASYVDGWPVYIPPGTVLINGTLNDTGGLNCRIFGADRDASIFKDNNSTGPSLRFVVQFGSWRFENFQIELAQSKPTFNAWEFESQTSDIVFTNFKIEGKSKNIGAILDFDQCWNVTFIDIVVRQYQGIGVNVKNDGLNGGNYRFIGGHFVFGRVGVQCKGTALNNSMLFDGTKWAFNQGSDHVNLTSLATFTAGSTSVNIGTGRINLSPNQHAFHLSNDNFGETRIMTNYDSGTGLATLSSGLENDWTSETSLELIIGSLSVITGQLSANTTFIATHHEFAAVVLHEAQGTVMVAPLFNDQETISQSKGVNFDTDITPLATFGLYLVGRNTRGTTILNPRYTTDRSDDFLCKIIDAAGDAGKPVGTTFIESIFRDVGGGESTKNNPFSRNANTSSTLSMGDGKIFIDTAEIKNFDPSTGSVIVDIPRASLSGTILFGITEVADAAHTILPGDYTIEMTSQTAARTVTLPGAPDTGREIRVVKSATGGDAITIDRNGNLINGAATNSTITVQHTMHWFYWVGGNTGWKSWSHT